VGYRNFCNKLWNATRFALSNLGTNFKPRPVQSLIGNESIEDLWILNKLNRAILAANEGFKQYDFANITNVSYSFWLYELCDVYLELLKPVMAGDNKGRQETSRETLYTCLDNGLRLLHPFMPFVTEELWQRLPRRPNDTESICIAPYPDADIKLISDDLDNRMKLIQEVVHYGRSLRASYNLAPSIKVCAYVRTRNAESEKILKAQSEHIQTLINAQFVLFLSNEQPPKGCALNIVNEFVDIFVLLKGIVDVKVEVAKLEKKKIAVEKSREGLQKRMASTDYETKVPQTVKEENTAKLTALNLEIDSFNKAIESLHEIDN